MKEQPSKCGSCTLCCKLIGVKELEKPKNEWCEHCNKMEGCSIYDSRPQGCVDYECLWLQSQDKEDPWPEYLRPDKSKVVVQTTTDGKHMVAFVDPSRPLAYKSGRMGRWLAVMSSVNLVYVAIGDKRVMLTGGYAEE